MQKKDKIVAFYFLKFVNLIITFVLQKTRNF